MTKEIWRVLWRAQRIARREAAKAFVDQMCFGTSFIKYGDFGEWRRDGSDVAKYIPAFEVFTGSQE